VTSNENAFAIWAGKLSQMGKDSPPKSIAGFVAAATTEITKDVVDPFPGFLESGFLRVVPS
jgi:hypothetical protein